VDGAPLKLVRGTEPGELLQARSPSRWTGPR